MLALAILLILLILVLVAWKVAVFWHNRQVANWVEKVCSWRGRWPRSRRKTLPYRTIPVAPIITVLPRTIANGPGKNVTVRSLREVQGVPKPASESLGANKKSKPNFNSRSPIFRSSEVWSPVPSPTESPASDKYPLEPSQTIEWSAPTSMLPAIQELITAGETVAAASTEALTNSSDAVALPVLTGQVLYYYAPAPDVPSIEHRKLSSNPLPQMPLLITLSYAEATKALFSFSPYADQLRIIGNGVWELEAFFAFELPPTEQFATIKNLTPGKLEKRDDAWYVVQKAEIALS